VHFSAAQANQRLESNCSIPNIHEIENMSCKVIMHSGSCIVVDASKLITMLGIKSVKNPNPYKVTRIDATSIEGQERC